MKAKVEWKENDCWKQVNVDVGYSRNNNYFFRHNGGTFVFPLLKDGTEVVSKNSEGKWVKVGRLAFGCIFLGEGETFAEHNQRMYLNRQFEEAVTA